MRTLAEDLLLFALDDEKGKTSWTASSLPYGLAGALLAELALRGTVEVREKRVAVVEAAVTGDDLLDDALRLISTSKKPNDARHWVGTFNGKVKHLRDRLEERLVAQGILRKEEHRILFIFPTDRYPTADPTVERGLREEVRAVLLEDATPDPRTVALISLLKSCDLLDNQFSKTEWKTVKARVKSVTEGETAGPAAKAAADAAAAVNTAIIAATTATAAAAAASSS